MPAVAHDVLDFWFAETNAAHWFVADAAFDAQIRERFGSAMDAAADGRLDRWAVNPPGWLALLILLDQFPRNLYRGDSRAWAQDASAQRVALSGIARGDDRQLLPLQRVFAYLPLEHAEDMALQRQSVALFEALCAEVPPSQRERFEEFLDYARRHRDVIALRPLSASQCRARSNQYTGRDAPSGSAGFRLLNDLRRAICAVCCWFRCWRSA